MNVTIDKVGRPNITGNDLFEIIYAGKDSNVTAPMSATDIKSYAELAGKHGIQTSVKFIDNSLDDVKYVDQCLSKWPMPSKYYEIDLPEYFASKINTVEQAQRVIEELNLYEKYNLGIVLKFMIYMVDTMREHGIVWGVGRGSSVSSYCLYLIGLHKIDSLKYNLDIKEFLK
jgi:Bacterial DNA polymerase III alpha NTPase domain